MSALCRSPRELSNEYLLAKFGFDTVSALSFFVFSVCLFFLLDSAGRQLPLSDSHSSSFRTTRICERTEVRCTLVLRPPGISVR